MARRRDRPRNAEVEALLSEEDHDDPRRAMSDRAARLIEMARQVFGELKPPIDVHMLASLRGLRMTDERPRYSPDAEIDPQPDGRVSLRVNPERPRVRRRFSVAHEIGHTFFPGFEERVHCRKPVARDWSDEGDVVEGLCDVAAAELLLPIPWFREAAAGVADAAGLARLAEEWDASRAATLRRYVEVDPRPVALVFLNWAIKPNQARRHDGDRPGWGLFKDDPECGAEDVRRLRVAYAVLNEPFGQRYAAIVPRHKSFDRASVVQRASESGTCSDETEWVDLGSVSGEFEVHAVPLWTPLEGRGPGGEVAVAAVLRPTWTAGVRVERRQAGLF
jgi:hypothetical protein